MTMISITKDNYKVGSLFQWDINQTLEIYGLSMSVVPEVHFAHDSSQMAIVQQATMDSAGVIRVDVPDVLLEKPNRLNVFVCTESGDAFQTIHKLTIPVQARPKPVDYVPDEEVYAYALHTADVEVVELAPDADATVEKVYDGDKITLQFGIPIPAVDQDAVVRDVLAALPTWEGGEY